ncbi:MAG TPA: hypothetical protein PLG52_03515, partial [Anaerolineales bacterium]|nr:hypothetical protein [Anaerolineales bacterium]
MKRPNEKNFYIFVSLLLEGVGAGMIIIPSHFGITHKILSIIPLWILGFSCFGTALAIQIHCVWGLTHKREALIGVIATTLLFIVSFFLIQSRQYISAAAMVIAGIYQTYIILPINKKLKQVDFASLSIAAITFATGIILSVTSAGDDAKLLLAA